jgi:hypothetical protein
MATAIDIFTLALQEAATAQAGPMPTITKPNNLIC